MLSCEAMLMGPLGDCNKLALCGLEGDFSLGDFGERYEALPGDPSPPR